MKRMASSLAVAAALFGAAAAAQSPALRWVATEDTARDDLSPARRLRIQYEIAQALNSPALRAALARRKTEPVSLQWPLRAQRDSGAGYHGVSNYVDHDAAFPGRLRDYACGTRTYDTAGGYNHAGTDYFLWPFPWLAMDEEAVAVVAAAPGVIVGRNDDHPDRSCVMSDLPWNAVYLRHDDGSITWYGHLKRGSVTPKQPGETVEAGEYLGFVGSSGSSTGPHLHFELHDAAGRVIDPRHGDCNADAERWSPPQPYEDPAINVLSLHTQSPEFVGCGVAGGVAVHEQTFATDTVAPGTSFHTFAAFRDHRNSDISTFTLKRPDGSEFARWQFELSAQNMPRTFYAATGWTWVHTLPADAPTGYWRFGADFHGRSYVREFFVGSALQARESAVARERAAAGALRDPATRQ